MPMADRMPGALDVVGQVMVEMGGESARIEAMGDRIVVEFPSFRAGASALGRGPRGRGRRDVLLRIHQALTAAGLTLQIDIGPSTVGVLGVEARPGLPSRLLGVGPLEVRLGKLFGSLRRPPAGPER